MSCCSGDKEQKNEKIDSCSPTKDSQATSCCSKEPEVEESSCCSSKEEEVQEPLIQLQPSSKQAAATTSCCSSEEEEQVSSSCCSNEEAAPGEEIEYYVYGMDCPSCASSLEKGLEKLDSVISAKVNYNSEKVLIIARPNHILSEFEKVIKNLGFRPEAVKQNKDQRVYDVQGMDCGSCAKSLENHMLNVAGVTEVQVSFAAGNMKIKHTNPVDEVIKEVSKVGFQASLHSMTEAPKKNNQNKQELLKVIFSGILISTGFIGSYRGLPELISTILFAIAIIVSGYRPIKSAYYALKSRSLDMNVLMSAAAIGAAIIGEWFEGATVVWLFSLGIALQNRSMDKTRNSIRNLMDMAPSVAWIKVGNELVEKRVEEIKVGDTIVIRPGDKVPLDGEILQGESSINQAPITGESLPVDKFIGDTVYAGTMNESGSLDVEVTRLVEDTTLSKIIHLVEEAQGEKAPTEAFIDRFAAIYTPIVFILALLVIVGPPLLGFGTWDEWTYKGLALLVVACPCALVISTPVAIVSAIGNAANHGVLIKGGTFLEIAGQIDTVAFDKTGTLTEGKPQVSEIDVINGTENDLLAIVYTLESRSTHPIAKTIVDYAREKDIQEVEGSLFKNIAGKGVEAKIDGHVYYAGNLKLFEGTHIVSTDVTKRVQLLQDQGKTIVMVGTETELLGIISVMDTIRPTAVDTLEHLYEIGMDQIVMLTGDNEGTAKMISEETRINRYFAELLPEDKVAALKQLQSEGKKVAMVGDGINDAPALATADLGIAMGGTGTDTAMETADVVLMADNLEKLPYTMKLSRKAIAIIKQNIWFSIIIKLAALILIFPGWLTLWMAVLSDTGAAIIVILNALRLLRVKDS